MNLYYSFHTCRLPVHKIYLTIEKYLLLLTLWVIHYNIVMHVWFKCWKYMETNYFHELCKSVPNSYSVWKFGWSNLFIIQISISKSALKYWCMCAWYSPAIFMHLKMLIDRYALNRIQWTAVGVQEVVLCQSLDAGGAFAFKTTSTPLK